MKQGIVEVGLLHMTTSDRSFVVDGLALPCGERIYGSTPFLRMMRTTQIALPEPAAEALGKLYTDVFVEQTVPRWNCHYGAIVLAGCLDQANFNELGDPLNIVQGEQVSPSAMPSGQLCGVFDGDGNLRHSMTGTSNPEWSLQFTGPNVPLVYARNDGIQVGYGGTLHGYTLAPIA